MPFGYKAAWSNAGTGGATWAEAEALAQRLAEDEQTLKRRFWQKLRALAARLPFAEDLIAAHYCAFDRQTPLHVKAALIGALAYFVLPADVVPDVCWPAPSNLSPRTSPRITAKPPGRSSPACAAQTDLGDHGFNTIFPITLRSAIALSAAAVSESG